jgi:hypothetical protein
MQEFDPNELIELAEAAIEGLLTKEQRSRLEALVVSNELAAKQYADYVSLHATLRLTQGNPIQIPPLRSSASYTAKSVPRPVGIWSRLSLPTFVLGLMLAMIGASIWFLAVPNQSSPIATIVETKGCQWGPGSLPTELGAELAVGRLRLSEGLARIAFSSGVNLRLEAPADLELVSPMKCIIRSGKLVASVPPIAKGFVVETPSSIVTDFGTEFGVSVGTDETATVHVFQGRVDTMHRQSRQTEVMHEGSMFYFGSNEYGPLENGERLGIHRAPAQPIESQATWLQLTTAQGKGRDVFVQPGGVPDEDRSKRLLMIKRPPPNEAEFERRAYLGFDLGELDAKMIEEAELRLTFSATGMGFASLVPNATFHVYGLVDGAHDWWRESELTWENAPAGRGALEPLDSSKVSLLGSFVMQQGDESSTALISGVTLCEFLNADTNQLATFIVERETPGRGGSSLVHGFASRHHPTLPPPTLRLRLQTDR